MVKVVVVVLHRQIIVYFMIVLIVLMHSIVRLVWKRDRLIVIHHFQAAHQVEGWIEEVIAALELGLEAMVTVHDREADQPIRWKKRRFKWLIIVDDVIRGYDIILEGTCVTAQLLTDFFGWVVKDSFCDF